MEEIKTIEDLESGVIPGWLFPKIIELGGLIIKPFDPTSLSNICYYLHFNNKFRMPIKCDEPINLLSKESIDSAFEPYREMEKCVLMPGKSVIAQTFEKLGLSEWLLAKLENTTSFGRIFINQASHGYMHPGDGMGEKGPFRLMVELTNLGERPVELIPAKLVDGEVIGPQCMRFYIKKLAYKAKPYKSISNVPKLKMDSTDRS